MERVRPLDGSLRPGVPVNYAYGLYDEEVHGARVVSHSGGGEGSGVDADMEILWDLGYTVVVAGNYDTPAARLVSTDLVLLLTKQSQRR